MRHYLLLSALLTAPALIASTDAIAVSDGSVKVLLADTVAADSDKVQSQSSPLATPVMRKGATGSTIYAFENYRDENNYVPSLCEIDLEGNYHRLWSYPMYETVGAQLRAGWMRNGRFCALAYVAFGSEEMIAGAAYQEMNPTTGEILRSDSYDLSETMLPFFHSAAYNPADDRVYGFGKSGPVESEEYVFKSAPASDMNNVAVISTLSVPGDRCPSLCYSPVDRCFYGVSVFGKFCRIDTDGTITQLFDVPIDNLGTAVGALGYSPYDGLLIWNPSQYATKATLYAIRPEAQTVEPLYVCDVDRQYTIFFSNDVVYDASAPAPATATVGFDGPELSGTVSAVMPSQTIADAPLDSDLTWSLKANGTQIASGTAAPGTTVQIPTGTLAENMYTFRLDLSDGTHTGYPAVMHSFAGYDTPQAPGSVTLDRQSISWTPATAGVHGGYMDATAVEYEVYLADALLGTTSECTFGYTLDPELPMACYRARVVAVSNDRRSQEGVSAPLVMGRPFDLPYTMYPTLEQAELVVTENRDGSPDYGTWRYTEAWGDPVFASGWSKDPAPDDWLILPAVNCPDHTVAYKVTLDAASGSSVFNREFFEVWAGTEPTSEAMTIPIISRTRAKTSQMKEYSNLFAVPRAGNYYIAIHCCSDPDMKDLIVRNIRIEATDQLLDIPTLVTELQLDSVDPEQMTATLSFVMPQTFINDNPITSDLTAVVQGVDTVEVTGAPGSRQTATVGTVQGDNIITVHTVANGIEGQQAEITVWNGMDLLMYVEDYEATLSEDNMTSHLTWSAPIESLNGGYFSQTGIKYWVTPVLSDGSVPEGVEMQLAGIDVFEYDYTVPDTQTVDYVRLAVIAENAAGLSPARWYRSLTIGKPHPMPLYEDWHNLTPTYRPLVVTTSGQWEGSAWDFGQPELVNEAFAHDFNRYTLVGYTDHAPTRARMTLPKFSTLDSHDAVRATLNLWTGCNAATDIKVLATTYGSDPEMIANVPAGDGWVMYDIFLPAKYLNRTWVTLTLDGRLDSNDSYLLLSNYRLQDATAIADADADIFMRQGNTLLAPCCDITVYSTTGLLMISDTDRCDISMLEPGIYVATATDSFGHRQVLRIFR